MKKKIYIVIFIVAIVFIVLFRKEIMNEIGKFEFVQNLTSKIVGIEPANVQVKDSGSGYYAYSTLNEEEKLVYNQIADCILNYKTEATISTKDAKIADQAFYCLMKDHPEIFWTDSYEMTSYNVSGIDTEYVFQPVYFMTKDDVEKNRELIETAVNQCLEGVPEGAGDYETAKYLYEYIILNTNYNKEVENDQNICSVFINKESVCAGYAKAFQYLLQKCGIESTIISGTAEGEPHAWNLIKLEDKYYYADVTWGDPQYGSSTIQKPWYVDYSFLAVTTEDLLKFHTIENSFEVPVCVDTVCNYYRKEGLYLEMFVSETLDNTIQTALVSNKYVSIRCADETVFKDVKKYLFEEENIWDLVPDSNITYSEDRESYVLTIFTE